ncbi:MAG: hypothetical protein ACRDV4_08895 [Acidimicrobiales bacterium]
MTTVLRDGAVGADIAEVIQSPVTDALVARLAADQVPVVSTLAIEERDVRLADDPRFVEPELYVRRVDAGEHEVGTIQPEKLADLVLVDQDPTTDVSRLATISMVMKGGQVIDRSTLELAGERPTLSGARTLHPAPA